MKRFIFSILSILFLPSNILAEPFSNSQFELNNETKNDIRRIRPGFGLSPKYYEKVLGSKLKRNVEKGDRVSLENTNLNKND